MGREITSSIGVRLTLIPAGEFMMGNGEPAAETAAFFAKNYGLAAAVKREEYRREPYLSDLFRDEYPQHRVRITRPFYLGACQVTRGQFRRFVDDTGYRTDTEKGEGPGTSGWDAERGDFALGRDFSWRNAGFEQTDDHPVVNVSWNDAVAFCYWLSCSEGRDCRLPTEAEWEYACRAGTTTRYWCGDDPEALARAANVADAALRAKFPDRPSTIRASDGHVFTAPVGTFQPNPFGLYDMHGNAWEWCSDRYDRDYYANSPMDDPKGPATGDDRVVRGGSWSDGPCGARSAARQSFPPVTRDFSVGFRVARTP